MYLNLEGQDMDCFAVPSASSFSVQVGQGRRIKVRNAQGAANIWARYRWVHEYDMETVIWIYNIYPLMDSIYIYIQYIYIYIH